MVRLIFTIFSISKHWNRMRSLGGGTLRKMLLESGTPPRKKGGGDGRRQAILHPQLFHRNKTTEEEKIPTDTLNCIVYLNISKFIIKL